jgi:hypothetical protein
MKRYKYQALVLVYPGNGLPGGTLSSSPHRMALRCRDAKSGHRQIFSTLISRDAHEPLRPGSPHVLATLRLADRDVTDYLNVGSRFSLWLDGNVGEGIITRCLSA